MNYEKPKIKVLKVEIAHSGDDIGTAVTSLTKSSPASTTAT